VTAPAVALRPLLPEDKDRLLAWRNSPGVAAFMYTDHEIGRDEHARWFAAIEGDERRAFWIIELDGRPVGLASFYDIDRVNFCASWAWYLAEAGARGRGVGRYVQYRMIEKAFADLGLRKLWCEALASNERALHLYRSFGFRDEPSFRRRVLKNGALEDVVGLGLLAEEWREIRPRIRQTLQASGFSLGD
jgi:UDP-4-amino-4,6-dideoxy-N-acetyl-beta-L-altrosamine N-acetyltransferase